MRANVGVWVVVLLAVSSANLSIPAQAQSEPGSPGLLYTTYVERDSAAEGESVRYPAVATMAADGSGARVVSPPDVRATMPTASPDGRWIVYTAEDGPTTTLKVIPAAGGEERLVAENASSAVWSPDGSMLGYVSGVGYEREVVVAEVVETAGDATFSATHHIPVHGYVSRPTFSPSGDAVVFDLAPGGDWNNAELWAAAVDGSQRWLLSPGLTTGSGIGNYSWSPDGSWIVFLGSGSSEPGAARAHLVRPDGSGLRRLSTQTCNYDDAVAWEPYGRYLAVIPACRGIHLVATDGTVINTLATEETDWFGRDIVFSADGTSLYITAQDRMNEHRLLQIPVDGSDIQTLQTAHPVDGYWLELLGPVHRPATPPPMPPPAPDEPPPEEWNPSPEHPKPSDLVHACPRDRVPATAFRDVDPKTRIRHVVDCAVWWKVVGGQSPHRFAPAAPITRAQLATVLAGVLDMRGQLEPTTTDYFDDDDGSVHETNINRLRESGVVQGSGRRFEPDQRVRREQVASFIVAAFERVTERVLPDAAGDRFDDDNGSVHEANINRAFDAHLVRAIGSRRFDPVVAQRRDDAADSAVRILDVLVSIGWLYQPTYGEAFVSRVVDGDTFIGDVHMDSGPVTKGVRIRMAGINAPERATCSGGAAKDTLRRGLERRRVRVSSKHSTSVGKNDRPIRFVHVHVHDTWIDISREMLRLGHALWMPHRVEPARQRWFNKTVQRAAAARVGMWDPMSCGVGPQQKAKLRVRVQPDAPGRDRDNLNGEVVRIRNLGTTGVRLDGWHLRESSQHPPYRFADGTRVPPGKTLTVHIGSGTDGRLRKYWGARRPLFDNPNATGSRGDGAYLYDPDGDVRFHHIYPCLVNC